MFRKFNAPILVISVLILVLTGCSKNATSSSIKADVILLDISGSSTNSVGSYSSEDHSPSSLSQRKLQLEEKIRSALNDRTAVYFGFVHKSYGSTDVVNLVPSSLILDIEKALKEDVLNEKLSKQSRDAISASWSEALKSESIASNSCDTSKIEKIIIDGSNGVMSEQNTYRIASRLCGAAANSIFQFNQLKGEPENIGSDIQGAIDRSLQKLASDERRLVDQDGRQLVFVPRIILVSDLIQVSNGKTITNTISGIGNNSGACDLAKKEASTFSPTYQGDVEIISDGFAGSKTDIKNAERDKLMSYWKCWFETRRIVEIDIGAKGIDLGVL